MKCWDRMSSDRAVMKGEVGMRGALVVERYLDDVQERLGSRLKVMCRAGCLPVMSRVAWELDLSRRHGKCPLCDSGEVEDVEHILLHCPAHQHHRSKMMASAAAVYATANNGAELGDSGEETQVRVLLGARAGSKAAEDVIDVQVKRFLVKVWKKRRRVSLAINDRLGRQDVVWAKDWGWSKPQLSDKRATHRRKCRAKRPLSIGKAEHGRRGEGGGQRAQQRGRYSP